MTAKLDLAQKLGATEGVNAKDGDAVMAVREMTGGGVDYSFECIGTPGTIQQAVGMIRKGGTCILVGIVPIGVGVELQPLDLVLQGKSIVASMMGSNRFRTDMPNFVEFYLDGRLRLDEMISMRLGLDEVNTAFEKMKTGELARTVITFN